MYCGECGSKISDDAKSSAQRGAKTEKAASASAEASSLLLRIGPKNPLRPGRVLTMGPFKPRGRVEQVILVAKSRPSVRVVDAKCPNWFLSLS